MRFYSLDGLCFIIGFVGSVVVVLYAKRKHANKD